MHDTKQSLRLRQPSKDIELSENANVIA